jgi:hypothetical protein
MKTNLSVWGVIVLTIVSFLGVACRRETNIVRLETKVPKSGEVTDCTYGLQNGILTYVVFQNAKGTLINQVEGGLTARGDGTLEGTQWLASNGRGKIWLPNSMRMYEITKSNIMECKLNINLQQLETYLGDSVDNHTLTNVYKYLHVPMPKVRVYRR